MNQNSYFSPNDIEYVLMLILSQIYSLVKEHLQTFYLSKASKYFTQN